MKRTIFTVMALALIASAAGAKKVKFDYSVVFVPEEGGVKFEKITEDADNVADYEGGLVAKASSIQRRPACSTGG